YLPNLFPLPITVLSCVRNHVQLSISSLSTTPNAMGKMLLFPSLPVAANICCPVLSLMKQPSKPMNGLHPFRKPSLHAKRQ
uniref:Uncharacterized protein n=1 Tax=Triticum urartu TaxID=4572 RepID=A0A8R7UZH8_TRIUA